MRLVLILAVFLCLVPPAAADSVPVIDNPREAPRVNDQHFEEVWRAGADESEDFIFGVIRAVVSDAHRNIYLLDSQQQQVFKFSPAGKYLGLVSRKGEGPGEINLAYHLHSPGEGRIAIQKAFPARIVLVDTAGTPLPGISLTVTATAGKEPGFPSLRGVAFEGNHLVAAGSIMHNDGVIQDNTSFVARFDLEGNEVHRYAQWASGYDFSQPITVHEEEKFQPFDDWDMDAAGRVYHLVEREDYLVQVDGPDGAPLFRIRRAWPVHKRSDEEKEKAKSNFSFSSNHGLPPISYDMADTDPAIYSLAVMGDELWVTSTEQRRTRPAEIPRTVSVFDLEGHLVEERNFHFPYDRGEDLIRYLPDGRVVRIKAFFSANAAASASHTIQTGEKIRGEKDFDEEAVLEVVVYRPVSP